MGKKSKNGGGGGGEKKATTTEVVLTVAMHCKCNGCKDKIRNGVKKLALVPGVEAVDKSAVESKGEVRLVVAAATAKPEKLKDRLHRVTGKKVDLLGGYYYSPSTYPAGGLVYPYTAAYPPPGQQLLGNGGGVVSPWYTHGY
uniref:HMA domain-containing protein n=1 Tax=Oryza glumipatula TaxID=40148 RepID=A0A0D9Z069_9ORYZ